MNCHGWTPALASGGARVRLSVTQEAGEQWQPGPSAESAFMMWKDLSGETASHSGATGRE